MRASDRVPGFNLLATYAVERFGPPSSCDGEVLTVYEGFEFVLRLGFSGGVTFEVETWPPETSVARLLAPTGFADEDAPRRVLEEHCAHIGVEIDWSSPEADVNGGRRVVTFRDPEVGLNAAASLIYRGETLVGVRFSLAL